MATDTSEKGLESLIVRSLIDEAGLCRGMTDDTRTALLSVN